MHKHTKIILYLIMIFAFVLCSFITVIYMHKINKLSTIPNSTYKAISQQENINRDSDISLEDAKRIALQHANIDVSQAVFLKNEIEYENGQSYFEIDFQQNTDKYEYTIASKDGTIIHWEKENMDSSSQVSSMPQTPTNTNYISEEKIKEMVQKKVPNAIFTSFEFEYDDGLAVYEGELREDWITEYSFKINAIDGTFLKWEIDYD